MNNRILKSIDENEKGEQNLSNKIEPKYNKVKPKFHEGDWVVGRITDNEPRQIAEITEDGYKTTYGGWIGFSFEEDVHLWTIYDAKDGDVLINKNYMGENPFIFKEIKPSNIKTNIPNPLTVLGYCGIGGAGFTKDSGWGDTVNCIYYPANKEQRSVLFKAIYYDKEILERLANRWRKIRNLQ